PWFLFAVPAGVITDRADRRRLMLRADIARTLLSLGIVGVALSAARLPATGDSAAGIAALAAFAFFLGIAEVLRDNAAQTALPAIVAPGDLERANGQLWSIEQVMGQFVGPPLAGLMIALAVPLPFGFDALTFAVSAAFLGAMTLAPRAVPPMPAGLWRQAKEGMAWLWSVPLILQMALMLGVLNLISTLAITVLVLFSQEVLGLTAAGHGILLTAGAAGGVAGGMLCPYIATRIGARASLRLAMLLFPLPMAVIWMATSPALVAVALFVQMFAALMWNVVTVSLRQRMIPDALLGRVNSLYRFLGWGLMPVGALLGGAVVSLAEPGLGREAALRLPYGLSALAMLGVMLYGYGSLRLPR
ncbi:MAG: MFS transporter, partial [Paracoccaceae bacterium]